MGEHSYSRKIARVLISSHPLNKGYNYLLLMNAIKGEGEEVMMNSHSVQLPNMSLSRCRQSGSNWFSASQTVLLLWQCPPTTGLHSSGQCINSHWCIQTELSNHIVVYTSHRRTIQTGSNLFFVSQTIPTVCTEEDQSWYSSILLTGYTNPASVNIYDHAHYTNLVSFPGLPDSSFWSLAEKAWEGG